MEHKEFMAEVQKVCKLDKQQCALLLNSLEKVLQEEAMGMSNIQIEGLGQFISHKHPEFIQENKETGEVVLFPPRITCRFQAEAQLDEE